MTIIFVSLNIFLVHRSGCYVKEELFTIPSLKYFLCYSVTSSTRRLPHYPLQALYTFSIMKLQQIYISQ